MAKNEETILLHFDIDEAPAVSSINNYKAANKQLTAERNKVNIATKEGRELVDKLNASIDKNNKIIKDNSDALAKQRQNVGNYSKSIQEAAGNLNIMGTNVGALGTKLASFVNPLTATVAVVGALGAAYARSSIGAKDLEFASRQLSAITTILTNNFAELISSSEDGEGFFSKLLDAALRALGPAGAAIAAQSQLIAQAFEDIEDLNNQAIDISAAAAARLGENQEFLQEINEEQTTFNRKLELTQKINENILANEREALVITAEKLRIAQNQLDQKKGDRDSEQRAVNLLEKELDIIVANTDKREKVNAKLIESINKQNQALIEQRAIVERTIARQEERERIERSKVDQTSFDPSSPTRAFDPEAQFERDASLINAELGLVRTAEQEKQALALQTNALEEQLAEEKYQRDLETAASARDLIGNLAAIADEGTAAQKALALTTIAINSGIGVSEAVKAGAGRPFPLNLAAILSGITAVLAGIAQAKSLLGFAEGGWTGPGSKYKPVGVVHADEYVTPKHIVHSPAAQPHLAALERMRTGYYDGGFVTNSNMQSTRDAMLTANFMKNLPPIYASWVEGRAVGKRVEFKEKVTRQ